MYAARAVGETAPDVEAIGSFASDDRTFVPPEGVRLRSEEAMPSRERASERQRTTSGRATRPARQMALCGAQARVGPADATARQPGRDKFAATPTSRHGLAGRLASTWTVKHDAQGDSGQSEFEIPDGHASVLARRGASAAGARRKGDGVDAVAVVVEHRQRAKCRRGVQPDAGTSAGPPIASTDVPSQPAVATTRPSCRVDRPAWPARLLLNALGARTSSALA